MPDRNFTHSAMSICWPMHHWLSLLAVKSDSQLHSNKDFFPLKSPDKHLIKPQIFFRTDSLFTFHMKKIHAEIMFTSFRLYVTHLDRCRCI